MRADNMKQDAATLKKIITAVGGECEDAETEKFLEIIEGRDITEMVAAGLRWR